VSPRFLDCAHPLLLRTAECEASSKPHQVVFTIPWDYSHQAQSSREDAATKSRLADRSEPAIKGDQRKVHSKGNASHATGVSDTRKCRCVCHGIVI